MENGNTSKMKKVNTFFDLNIDQEEKNDLKTKEKKRLEKMKVKLAKWEKTVLEPIPL
jgi:hypothetical protein